MPVLYGGPKTSNPTTGTTAAANTAIPQTTAAVIANNVAGVLSSPSLSALNSPSQVAQAAAAAQAASANQGAPQVSAYQAQQDPYSAGFVNVGGEWAPLNNPSVATQVNAPSVQAQAAALGETGTPVTVNGVTYANASIAAQYANFPSSTSPPEATKKGAGQTPNYNAMAAAGWRG